MVQRRDASQVVSLAPSGDHPRWLGEIAHVAGLTYSSAYPGGCDKASWVLQKPPTYRDISMDPGRIIRIYRGASIVWQGQHDEPQPADTGWTMTAHGNGSMGTQFDDVYTTWDDPDDHVNQAIARGLPWRNPGISTSGLWLGDQVDSASETITDFLNSITVQGGKGWTVDRRDGTLSVAALPAAADRILVATSPVPRTVNGDVNSLWLYYQATADDSATGAAATYGLVNVTNAADIDRHGTWEDYYDISDNGVMTSLSAESNGQNVLARYNRASFAGPFQVQPGQLLTLGGYPVDLAAEQAGHVCRLVLTDYGYGGEVNPGPVSFCVGAYAYNDQAQTAQITPYQSLDQSLTGLLSMENTILTPIAAAS